MLGRSYAIAPIIFEITLIVQMKRTPKAGDRYSKPTTHNRNDTDKILATCGDNYLSLQAIAD